MTQPITTRLWPTMYCGVPKNRAARSARSALTAAGVAIGVGLIVALLSLAAGVRRTANDLIHVGRADFGLFQSGVVDFTRSLLPNSLAARVRGHPGVEDAAPLKLLVTSVNGHDGVLVFGLEPGGFPAQRLVVVAGRRGEALVGDHAARRLHLRPGGRLDVGKRGFRVAGIYHSGNSFEDGGVVLPLGLVERLSGHPGEATTVAVEVAPGRRPAAVARELRARPAAVHGRRLRLGARVRLRRRPARRRLPGLAGRPSHADRRPALRV